MSEPLPGLEEAERRLEALGRTAPPAAGTLSLETGTDAALILDAPGSRGALTVAMMHALAAAVRTLHDDPPRTVTLRSAHPAMFCSGGHLGQVRASLLDGGSGLEMARCMTAVLDALWNGPWLVVAVVDGPALGGGAELLTACDRVHVSDRARIGFVHGRLGVAPGWGGAARLVAAVGRRTALDLLGSAAVLRPDEAIRAGLASGRAAGHADWMGQVQTVSRAAVHAAKRQVLAARTFERNGDAEARLFASVWGSPEHRKRLSS
jgi:ethylmalonyl-CoA/methylmalonyl-CoA decarboxylase